MRDNKGSVGFSPPVHLIHNVCHYPNRLVSESIPVLKYPVNNLSHTALSLLLEVRSCSRSHHPALPPIVPPA